jgi:FkbM family methyltransferase
MRVCGCGREYWLHQPPLARKRPDLKIVAIEASPWIFKVLMETLNKNGQNISALNHAAYFESGKEMFIYAPRELFGKAALILPFTKEGEAVSTITIDDIRSKFGFSGIDFVKVDVEGFEICVFKG